LIYTSSLWSGPDLGDARPLG